MDADLAGLQVDRLPVAVIHAFLEIHDSVLAETGDGCACLRVERDKAITGRHIEHALVAAPVSPVRQSASGQLSGCGGGPLALTHAVSPHELARRAVEGDDRPPGAAGGVKDSLDHEGCP